MADDRRRAPNWRTTAARGSASAGGSRAEPGKKRRGGGKRFLLLAAFLAVVGIIVGWLTLFGRTPPPVFLGVAVTEYTNVNYPSNHWAQQDSEALRQLFG